MKKAIVTGSHGFIGSNLVAALEKSGVDVLKYDVVIEKDLFELDGFPASDIDAIFHLACINQERAVNSPRANLRVNALSCHMLANLAKEHNIPLIYTSTASVYGNATKLPTPVWHPANPQSDYAAAKLCGESFIKNSGCDYRIFRLSNVYGQGQTVENPYCGVVAKFFDSAMNGRPLGVIGDGTQTRDFTYVDDVVDVLLNFDSFSQRTLNVSYGREISIINLARDIQAITEPTSPVEYISERPVDGIARRLLLPDVLCPTTLSDGLVYTYKSYVGRNS